MMGANISMGISCSTVVEYVWSAGAGAGNIVMTAFCGAAIHDQVLLPVVVERITAAAGELLFGIEAAAVGNGDPFGQLVQLNTGIAKVAGSNVAYPAIFNFIKLNGCPAMIFCGIAFKG